MNIVSEISHWHTVRQSLGANTIGFVPTMGNLHAGHLSLCQRAQQENAVTVVSIFVNPTQFNQPQDFNHYPRTLEADLALLRAQQVDYVFFPQPKAMYADDYQVQIHETELSLPLEGEYRPGHFIGMLTIVLKLLNIIQPSRAYFGEKDYQQLLLVQKMVKALFLPVEIIACRTVRADDGLALSSRNHRLDAAQRQLAPLFPQLLHSADTLGVITAALLSHGFKIDYIAERWQRRLGAVWLGDIRLIDNIPLEQRAYRLC